MLSFAAPDSTGEGAPSRLILCGLAWYSRAAVLRVGDLAVFVPAVAAFARAEGLSQVLTVAGTVWLGLLWVRSRPDVSATARGCCKGSWLCSFCRRWAVLCMLAVGMMSDRSVAGMVSDRSAVGVVGGYIAIAIGVLCTAGVVGAAACTLVGGMALVLAGRLRCPAPHHWHAGLVYSGYAPAESRDFL
jgi:hypothetical protein